MSANKKKYKVLILLAAYNGSKYIKEQLDSIIVQKGVNLSIVVSLDLSDDNTLDILKAYSDKYKFIEILPYGEKFGSAGKNFFHLIKEVTHEYFDFIAFADQDDIWLENKILSAIDLMRKNDKDGYSSNVIAFWENGKKKLIKKDDPQTKYDYLFESPGPGCTFVLSNQLFMHVKEYISHNYSKIDELWLHDWFCYSFARFNGYQWIIDSEPGMLYRQHELNQVGANSGFKSFINRASVMFNGSGMNKVLSQANFSGQNSCQPIQLIYKGRIGYLTLAFTAFKFRRKFIDKFLCSLLFFSLSITGLKVIKFNEKKS